MIGRGDFWLALGAAAGLHVGALAFWPVAMDGGGSGESGNAVVSVTAADASLAALVQSWDASPVVAVAPDALVAPEALNAGARPEVERAVTTAPGAPLLPLATNLGTAPERGDAPDAIAAPEFTTADIALAAKGDAPRRQRDITLMQVAAVPTALPEVDAKPTETRALAASPRPDPRPSRPAVKEQRTAGTGGGTTTGRATENAARSTTSAQRAAAQARWAADIQRRIARHQAYPRGTRASGKVQVSMVILKNGSLGEVSVARSSGAAPLDQAALRAVQLAAPFPPAPEALTDTWYRVGQWISFERR